MASSNKMIVSGNLNKKQLALLRESFKKLDLLPAKRQRLLWRMAKYGVIAATKRYVRHQQSPHGKPWPARKTRQRGKMLRNLPRWLRIREMPEQDAVRLYLQGGGYRNGATPVPAGVVGHAQNNGMKMLMRPKQTSSSRKRDSNTVVSGRMATLKQAKKLRALDYQVRKGESWRKPSYKEITENMCFFQAGLLIKKISGHLARQAWTVELPPRQFLGISDEDFNQALARQLQAIGFGWQVKAQDIKGKA